MAVYGHEMLKETIHMNYIAGCHFAYLVEKKLMERKYHLLLKCTADSEIY